MNIKDIFGSFFVVFLDFLKYLHIILQEI